MPKSCNSEGIQPNIPKQAYEERLSHASLPHPTALQTFWIIVPNYSRLPRPLLILPKEEGRQQVKGVKLLSLM